MIGTANPCLHVVHLRGVDDQQVKPPADAKIHRIEDNEVHEGEVKDILDG